MAVITEHSKPGVYVKSRRVATNKITLQGKTVAGFLGVSEKGPMDTPVLITDFNQYLKVFGGFGSPGYLAYAVYTFFNCGGNSCYVVRTAHKGEQGAAPAALSLESIVDSTTLSLRASSEGVWGNRIRVRIWHAPDKRVDYSIQEIEDEKCVLSVSDRLQKGDVLRILYQDGTNNYHLVSADTAESKKFECEIPKNKINNCVVQTMRFNISVSDGKEREEYLYLSANDFDERYFKKVLNKSNLFIINNEGTQDHDMWFPQEKNEIFFCGGKDGVLEINAGDFIGYFKGLNDNKGLGIFESLPAVNVLCVPDVKLLEHVYAKDTNSVIEKSHTIYRAMIDQAERMGDRFAVIEIPDSEDLKHVLAFAGKYDSSYASAYYPSLEIIDPRGKDASSTVFVPVCGIVAGIMSDCDENEGVFRAPAGKFITGAVGMKYEIDDQVFETLYSSRINGYKRIPGRGIKLWGARTLSSDIEWRYINVRRTYSKIAQAIKDGLGWAVFEPNTFGLRKRIVRHVTAFLIDLWRKGYLAGKTPEEAFFVVCNDELNPPEKIDAGIITTSIGLAITKPAEYITITLNAIKDDANVIIEEV